MKARIHDPVGPRWTRAVVPALAVIVAAVDVLAVPGELGPGIFAATALAAFAPVLLGRHRSRACEIELGDGAIHVRRAGILTQTIRAKAVTGASATTSESGVCLALALEGRRDHPVLLELASEKDADAVRSALGIGHFGAGMLSFRASRRADDVVAFRLRFIIALTAIGAAALAVLAPEATVALAVFVFGVVAVIWALMQRLARNQVAGRIALDRHGLHVGHETSVETLPFAQIDEVEATSDGLLVWMNGAAVQVPIDRARHRLEGLTEVELAHVETQIRTASRRAHGLAKPAPAAGSTTELARRGEDARSWLARLDAASKMLGAKGQYRGAGVTEADLWTVLENPDAPVELRAAAARVLTGAREAEARPRIEATLAKVHERDVEARIRVMLEPDVDTISRELDTEARRART